MRRLTRRQRTAAAVLALVALCFITLDLGGGTLRDAHSGVRGALGSLYRGTDAVVGPARRWVEGVPSAGSQQSTIDRLRGENARLRGRIAALQAEQRTSGRLTELARAADASGQRLLPARVVAYGPGQGFDWTVTLDAGSGDGVRDLRTGEIGVATGLGADGFSFAPLDPGADIRLGDQLVTGPNGSTSYVAGIQVGTVRSVRTSADGT